MKTLETITFAAAASALILISTNVSADVSSSCYDEIETYNYETKADNVDQKPKDIHIDVKRPQNGKTNVEYVYDASNSKTPSGKAEYRWERQNGGFELLGPTDQATVTVKAEQSEGGVNTYTLLTVSDPVCGRSSQARIDVSYYQ
jgi:hypothetical protein